MRFLSGESVLSISQLYTACIMVLNNSSMCYCESWVNLCVQHCALPLCVMDLCEWKKRVNVLDCILFYISIVFDKCNCDSNVHPSLLSHSCFALPTLIMTEIKVEVLLVSLPLHEAAIFQVAVRLLNRQHSLFSLLQQFQSTSIYKRINLYK